MNKIRVGAVISESVNFSFRKYLPLLGVLWLPMLISLLFTYFVMLPHFLAVAAGAGGLRPAPSPLAVLAMDSVHLALLAVMSVGVTKEVLGLREGPRFVYLSVGVTELRVFGGYILLALISLVLVIALAIILGFVVAMVSKSATGADPAAIFRMRAMIVPFATVGVLLSILYFLIRLSSFQSAVAVAEHRFGLWRSWALSRGNFWRLFAIVMAIGIPLMVLYVIALAFMMGPAFTKLIAAVPAGPVALRAAQREMMLSAMSNFKYGVLIGLPVAPVLYGLVIAPAAFAYRALVPSARTDAAAVFE